MSDPAVPPIEPPLAPYANDAVTDNASAVSTASVEPIASDDPACDLPAAAEPETFAEEFEGSLAELVSYLRGKVKALEADVKALLSKV